MTKGMFYQSFYSYEQSIVFAVKKMVDELQLFSIPKAGDHLCTVHPEIAGAKYVNKMFATLNILMIMLTLSYFANIKLTDEKDLNNLRGR